MTNANVFESNYSKDTIQKPLIHFPVSLNGALLLLGRMNENHCRFRNSTAEQIKFQASQA